MSAAINFNPWIGLVATLARANVDTDAIMPKQFLKSIKRVGYGDFIFDEWRYLDKGEPGMNCAARPVNLDFELNWPRYKGASILLTQDNFGCGSSREHAPWGLHEYGFRVIIAPSFAEIFYSNCIKNGILLITLPKEKIESLFELVYKHEGMTFKVDLLNQLIEAGASSIPFNIAPSDKERLLYGLDEIEMTLQYAQDIRDYEQKRAVKEPWIFLK